MRHRFFLKLLASFLVAGVLPAVLLAASIGFVLVGSLKSNLEDQAQTALDNLARGIEAELVQTAGRIDALSLAPETLALFTGTPNGVQLSALSRKLADERRDDEGLELHVTTEGFLTYATSDVFPEIHRPDRYASWGILRRSVENPGQTVFFPTRFAGTGNSPVILSAARYLQGTDRNGWVLADLSRDRLYRRSGLAGQTLFRQVVVVGGQGTVVLDLRDPAREDRGWWRPVPAAARKESGPAGLVLVQPLHDGGLILEATLPLDQFSTMTRFLQTGAFLAAGISLLMSLGLAWFLSRTVSQPVSLLVGSMARVEAGDFTGKLVSRRRDELGEALHRFNTMVDRISALVDQTKEEQRLLRISESKALQAQINPHFLYNTLNSIKALATEGRTEDIRTVVVSLGRLLRSNIENRDETETVDACLKLLAGYFEIENLRFGGRFTFEVHVDPALAAVPIPRFLLQPLVENALFHGLEAKRGPGTVVLTGAKKGDEVLFMVEDDGIGIAPDRLKTLRETLAAAGDPGTHVGLRNVHRRLVLLYGEGAGLTLVSTPGEGTRVTIRWQGGTPC